MSCISRIQTYIACLVMVIGLAACQTAGAPARDGTGIAIASPIPAKYGRIVVVRETGSSISAELPAADLLINDEVKASINSNAAYVFDLPAGHTYRLGLKYPWYSRINRSMAIGSFVSNLKEGSTAIFELDFSRRETLSSGGKATSIIVGAILSGTPDDGVQRTMFLREVPEADVAEKLELLKKGK